MISPEWSHDPEVPGLVQGVALDIQLPNLQARERQSMGDGTSLRVNRGVIPRPRRMDGASSQQRPANLPWCAAGPQGVEGIDWGSGFDIVFW